MPIQIALVTAHIAAAASGTHHTLGCSLEKWNKVPRVQLSAMLVIMSPA